MKKILLSRGKYAIVDNHRFKELNQYKWHCLAIGYAARTIWKNGKTAGMIYMHRVVNNTPNHLSTDHINGDKLDNRECNLRSSTKSQNSMNRPVRAGRTSIHRGVDWNKKEKKWRGRVVKKGKEFHLGWFKTELEALKAVTKKRKELYGDFVYEDNKS